MSDKELDEIVDRNMRAYFKNAESYISKMLPTKDKMNLEGMIEISDLYKKNHSKEWGKNIFLILILLLSFANFIYNCVKEKKRRIAEKVVSCSVRKEVGGRMEQSKETKERKRIAGEILDVLKKEKLTVGTATTILGMVDRELRRFASRRELS